MRFQLSKFSIVLLWALSACTHSQEYKEYYSYLNDKPMECKLGNPCNDYIIFLVDARHMDYTSLRPLMKTISKHPSDGSKNSDVGHAWIYLKTDQGVIEGGHSAETGLLQPKYLEGVCLLSEKCDPNPARYFWAIQKDGYFEPGWGGHRPTFALKINLSSEEVAKVQEFISCYQYEDYSLTGNNCVSFVAGIASLLGIELDIWQTVELDSSVTCAGEKIKMWTDPCYQHITFGSPDRLERSLIRLALSGRGESVRNGYLLQRDECFITRTQRTGIELKQLPFRTLRAIYLY